MANTMNPYHDFVSSFARLVETGKSLPLGGISPHHRLKLPAKGNCDNPVFTTSMNENHGAAKTRYNRFLLFVAGLGGLLYGVDVGIIAGALPYLEATSGLNAGQLSFIVAAVLLGSVISTLFAGLLADWLGRKKMMIVERHSVCHQHSDDCAGARLLAAGFWPLAAGHQRRA